MSNNSVLIFEAFKIPFFLVEIMSNVSFSIHDTFDRFRDVLVQNVDFTMIYSVIEDLLF